MNFFGHAAVASLAGADAVRCLGAMLPDFATMSRSRLVGVRHGDLDAGVADHHAVDGVFHRLPLVQRWMSDAAGELRRAGLARGPALGAAHVGVELLLDGFLLDDERAASLYLAALEAAHQSAIDRAIDWADDDRSGWHLVRGRLCDRGLPEIYRAPARVAVAVERVLSPRPRLAFADGDARVAGEVFATVQRRMRPDVATLMSSLQAVARALS